MSEVNRWVPLNFAKYDFTNPGYPDSTVQLRPLPDETLQLSKSINVDGVSICLMMQGDALFTWGKMTRIFPLPIECGGSKYMNLKT